MSVQYDEELTNLVKKHKKTPAPSPSNPPGILEDLGQGIQDFFTGAKQGTEEVLRSMAGLREINSLANPFLDPASPATVGYYVSADEKKQVPVMNDQEQKIWNWYTSAMDEYREGTVAPTAGFIAALATIPAIGAGTGLAVLGGSIGRFAIGASMSYLPFMAHDIADSLYSKGMGDTAKEMGLGMIPGYGNYQLLQDENFQAYSEEHPGQALGQHILTALDTVAPFSHSIGKLGRKGFNVGKRKLNSLQQMNHVEIVEELRSRNFIKNLQDIKKRVREGKLRPQDPSLSEVVEENLRTETQNKLSQNQNIFYSVQSRDRKIEIKPSTLTKPVRAKDIMHTLKTLTNIGIDHLWTDENVRGYFEPQSEAIRVSGRFNFETMAHELGHKLDKKFQIQGHEKELYDRYLKTFDVDTYEVHEQRGEGIAEFMVDYLLNPQEAEKNCPNFYQDFITKLSEDPKLEKQVNLLGEQIRQWFHQEPGARVSGVLDFEETSITNPKDFIKGLYEKGKKYGKKDIKQGGLDKHDPLKQMVKEIEKRIGTKLSESDNFYHQAQAFISYARARSKILLREKWSPQYQIAFEAAYHTGILKHKVFWGDIWENLDYKNFQKKHSDWLKQNNFKNPREAFAGFQTAKHIIKIFDYVREEKIKEIEAEMEKVRDLTEIETKKPFPDTATLVAYSDQMRELFDKLHQMEDPNYHDYYKSPISYEDAEKLVQSAPTELFKTSLLLHRFNENILNLAKYYGLTNQKIINKYLRVYSDYIPLHRVFEGDIDSPAGFYELNKEGSERYIKDPLFEYEKYVDYVIKYGEKNKVKRTMIDLCKKIEGMGDFFHYVADDTPVDEAHMTFVVWEGGKRNVYQAQEPMLYDWLKTSRPQELSADLNLLSTLGTIFREGITTSIDFTVRQLLMDTLQAFVNTEKKSIVPFMPFVDSIEGICKRNTDKILYAKFEVMGVPHTTFINAYKTHRSHVEKVMGKNFSEKTALNLSIGALNKIWKLYTGALQRMEEAPRLQEFQRILKETGDYDKAARAAREITIDFTQAGTRVGDLNKYIPFLNATVQGWKNAYDHLKSAPNKDMVRKRLGLLTLAGVALWQYNHTQEWYQNVDMDTRNRFFLFSLDDGEGTIICIPKPQLYGAPTSIIERLLDYYVSNNEEAPETLKPYLAGILDINKIPQIVKVLFEVSANKNLFTDKEIVPPYMQKIEEPLQYDVYTSHLARGIGSAFNYSPMKVDHVLKGMTGTLGKNTLDLMDYIVTGFNTGKPSTGIENKIVTMGILKNTSQHSENVRLFYKYWGELEEKYTTDKHLLGKSAKKPLGYKDMNKSIKDVGKLWTEMRKVVNNDKMTPDQKQAKIKDLYKQILNKTKKAVEKYQKKKQNQKE